MYFIFTDVEKDCLLLYTLYTRHVFSFHLPIPRVFVFWLLFA